MESIWEGEQFLPFFGHVAVFLEAVILDFHVVDAVYERKVEPGLEFWNPLLGLNMPDNETKEIQGELWSEVRLPPSQDLLKTFWKEAENRGYSLRR